MVFTMGDVVLPSARLIGLFGQVALELVSKFLGLLLLGECRVEFVAAIADFIEFRTH
jgi:hypothetical protein